MQTPTELQIRENVPLAPMTTLGIGGDARWFIEVTNVDELRAAIEWAQRKSVPIFFLGGGSNLLISDRGFDGLVVKVALRGSVASDDRKAGEDARDTRIRVGAGEEWDVFVAFAVKNNLAGIECLSGIPGTVGAAPIQNVGAYGQEVAETIDAVHVLDRRDLSLRVLTTKECEFGYRYSFFKNVDPHRYVVTAVDFRLEVDGAPKIRYPELRKYLDENAGPDASLQQTRDAVIAIRKRKGMVIDPNDPDSRSAGSFFMNPVLPPADFAQFVKRAAAAGQGEPPQFPTPDGKIKTSAAWLIEHAGFHKGYGDGRVGLSTKHTLAIVNRGGATSEEAVALVRAIQERVRDVFGIEIHPEPNFIGF